MTGGRPVQGTLQSHPTPTLDAKWNGSVFEASAPNGLRFCCGAPRDGNTDGLNPTAPPAASAG